MTEQDPARDAADEQPQSDAQRDAELLVALRLAEALDRVEAGRPSGLDAVEDPELTGLVRAATLLRGELRGAGDGHAYHSFRARSRAAVLHALESAPESASTVETAPARILPFYRRSAIVRPFAAVAAAAAIVVAAIGGAGWATRGGDAINVATNLTPRSTAEELDRLTSTLTDIQTRTQAGQSVPALLLRALSEGTARFANLIEQTPDQVSETAVRTYIQAAQAGSTALNSATVDQDAQGALAAAQRAARDGVVVATRYLDAAPAPVAPAGAVPAATSPGVAPVTPATGVKPATQAAPTTGAPASTTGAIGAAKPAAASPAGSESPASDIVR